MSGLLSSTVDFVNGIGRNIGDATSGVAEAIHDWISSSDQNMVAFFGVLFAIAKADGDLSEQELSLIFSSPKIESLSENDRKILQSYSCEPPSLEDSLQKLVSASQELKFGLIFYICNLILVDDFIHPEEQRALDICKKEFGINDVQVQSIQEFSRALVPVLKDPSMPPPEDMQQRLERMQKVGIPIASLGLPSHSSEQEMEYSDENFWEKMKIVGFSAGKVLIEQVLLLWYVFHDPNTSSQHKLIIAGALAYWILPVDLVPDMLPVVGFSDDLSAIATAIASIAMSITPAHREKARRQIEDFWASDAITVVPEAS